MVAFRRVPASGQRFWTLNAVQSRRHQRYAVAIRIQLVHLAGCCQQRQFAMEIRFQLEFNEVYEKLLIRPTQHVLINGCADMLFRQFAGFDSTNERIQMEAIIG